MTRLLVCGDLTDMQYSGKGGLDPIASGTSLLASDVLWSDPTHVPGMRANTVRGSGVLFGPDVTEEFLKRNGLKLIIRWVCFVVVGLLGRVGAIVFVSKLYAWLLVLIRTCVAPVYRRSHESPDARSERLAAGMVQLPPQQHGFSVDHDTPGAVEPPHHFMSCNTGCMRFALCTMCLPCPSSHVL